MVCRMFRRQPIWIPTISKDAQPELRHPVRRAPPFRLRELRNARLAKIDWVDYWLDYEVGEGHVRREAPLQPESAFHVPCG